MCTIIMLCVLHILFAVFCATHMHTAILMAIVQLYLG